MTPTTEQKRGGAILGWVCLGLGLAVMYWSRWTFIAYVPLLLLALIFSLIAMARSGGLGAMLLLLGTLIGPSVMWIALDGTESDPRSKQAEKDKNPIDQKSRSVLVNNPVNRPTLASIRPAVGATAETLPDAPVPHAAVPDQRTVADAQRRALIAYPALDVANSPLRLEYLARRKRYLVENKKFFNDADWPMKLAEECQQAIEGK